ncbi:EamA family transporter RarD [Actinocrinis puniceicyclus]|uniref:EamA family transporter RarD n=1 Tax=Actinocrinis puniceicyclus TaxID=977794 RepID=A0A8J8BCX8_9ACTN|nr:EamA family transporter RarD [Actinocrinis puniceicyclus]MBS2962214.1 EamA family transporter RarD [Actinocrinis puniceicyclus]
MTAVGGREARKGLVFGLAAYGLWGLFPLYWPLLKPAGATEILAHRMLWSLIVVALLLAVRRNWSWIAPLRRTPAKIVLLCAAAVVVSVNWGVYIWAVNKGHVVETSLGYFINPLVTVLFGVLILRERLRPLQWAAVGVGAGAIVELVVGFHSVPWIALILAFSFGSYGLFKKLAGVPAAESMAVETSFQFLPALAYLAFLQSRGTAAFGHVHWPVTVLLAACGVVTVIPLMFFAAAANRLPLSTIGLLQFITPVLQLSCGVFVAHEFVPGTEWVGFAIVWLALALLTYDSLGQARKRRALAQVPAAAEESVPELA